MLFKVYQYICISVARHSLSPRTIVLVMSLVLVLCFQCCYWYSYGYRQYWHLYWYCNFDDVINVRIKIGIGVIIGTGFGSDLRITCSLLKIMPNKLFPFNSKSALSWNLYYTQMRLSDKSVARRSSTALQIQFSIYLILISLGG